MRFLRQSAERCQDNHNGLSLDQLRNMRRKEKRAIRLSLHPYGSKWALQYYIPIFGGRFASGWLLAEKSGQVRQFSSSDTALNVAREFGLDYIKVDLLPRLDESRNAGSPPLPLLTGC